MKKRSYQQYCPLAMGLDIIGQRWTFLIIRELLIAPKRYKALLENLPGMGTNLLADRLKSLMNSGVIEQIVQLTPNISKVYQLTDLGRKLEKPVLALTQWGSQFLDKKQSNNLFRSEWGLVAMKAAFNPQKAKTIDIYCDWQIDNLAFYIHVNEEGMEIASGKSTNPIAKVTTNAETLEALVFGKKNLKEVITSNNFKITGSGLALVRLLQTVLPEDRVTLSKTRDKPSPKRRPKKQRILTLSAVKARRV